MICKVLHSFVKGNLLEKMILLRDNEQDLVDKSENKEGIMLTLFKISKKYFFLLNSMCVYSRNSPCSIPASKNYKIFREGSV